jgi:hypothetical protein
MARIPGAEDFGNVVARAAAVDQRAIPQGTAGGAIGAGLSDAAAYMQRQADEEAMVAKRTQEAAEKATAMGALTRARDTLADLHDRTAEEVRTGQIDKTKAAEEWQARANETLTAAMEGVPQAHRTAVQEDLLHQSSRFARGIGKAVEQRDRSDVRSGIAQTIEHAQRLYLENPAAADQMANDTLTQLGPFGGMAPAEIQQARQAYMEGTRFTKGQAMVSGARRDNAALDKVAAALESEQFQDMDPGRKGQLLTQIEGYKVSNVQRMEADARRRQAEEERRMRHAESQFNAANSIITTGKVLSPEYVEQVSKSVAGTPYELAFKESLKQAPERTAFGMQPLATMERILTQARAELNARGTNPQAEKTIKAMEEIRNEASKTTRETRCWQHRSEGSFRPSNRLTSAAFLGCCHPLRLGSNRPVSCANKSANR